MQITDHVRAPAAAHGVAAQRRGHYGDHQLSHAYGRLHARHRPLQPCT